jgi:hypothetical protein
MTATPSIELPAWMAEQLSQASPDLLRQMVQIFAEALMSADADAVCGAAYGQRSTERRNTRNGLSVPGLGHPGRQHRAGGAETAGGQLLPPPRSAAFVSETRSGSRNGARPDVLNAKVAAWSAAGRPGASATMHLMHVDHFKGGTGANRGRTLLAPERLITS